MMGAVQTSEHVVNFYYPTQRYKPEDNPLRTHHCENLSLYLILWLQTMGCGCLYGMVDAINVLKIVVCRRENYKNV